MAHEHKASRQGRIGRRQAIALFGLLAGMASAALLTHLVQPPATTVRIAI